MKIVVSPAKSLDLTSEIPTNTYSEASFLDESQKIAAVLKKKSPKKLSELMAISPALADLNWQRNQDWQLPFTKENARQAVYTFSGDVYLGLDVYTLPEEKLEQLQNKLRILSGLYGMLKPFDLMQAYRLEMGTKLKLGRKENLYQFWDDKVTKALNNEMQADDVLINLASNEYYKVIKSKLLKCPVITPQFKDYKDGKLKMISFFAKRARGLMVRYILDNNINNVADLKGFNYDGYAFNEALSSEKEWVFVR